MTSVVYRFADLSVMATNTGSNSFANIFHSLLEYAKFLHKNDLENNRDDADNYYRLRLISISNLIYSFDDDFDIVYPCDLAELEIQVNMLIGFISDAMNIGEHLAEKSEENASKHLVSKHLPTCYDQDLREGHFKCSACEYPFTSRCEGWYQGDDTDFSFCPNCGRRVIAHCKL